MKTTTCQLVQGGVITGYVHYIGSVGPNGNLWPLCDQPQIRLCQPYQWTIMPAANSANCPRCAKVEDRTPLVYDHTPLLVGIR